VLKEGEIQNSFYSWNSEFYGVLKRRVVARLEERNLNRRGSYEIWMKAFFLIVGFWVSLFMMVTTSNFIEALLYSICLGCFAAFIGTCIQHDGNHGAFACNRLVNKLAGWTQDMIGASAFTWEVQHMLGHHPYTNLIDADEEKKKEDRFDCPLEMKDQESDPDVFSSFPLMRMHPLHKPEPYHRYQHIYAPLLFSFMTLVKVFHQDYEVAIKKRLYHIDANCIYGSYLNTIRFWTMKVISMVYMIWWPCFFQGMMKGLILFVVSHCVCGQVLATMFIVNHVIEGVSFAKKGETVSGKALTKPTGVDGSTPMDLTQIDALKLNKNLPKTLYNDWAAVQCQTSVNWSAGSWFWNHFSGGLSHQIEHHLFPSICHTNYVHIQDIVEKTCIEYGVPYRSEPNLVVAYFKMLSHLKSLGADSKRI